MDHWTVNQVADWLKNNALEQFVQTFIGRGFCSGRIRVVIQRI